MASKNFTRFFVLFFTLAVSNCFAQTRYIAVAQVDDPVYGLAAQLWNGSNDPITLESVEASGLAFSVCDSPTQCHAYTPADGAIEFGYGLSNLEEQQCQQVPAFVFGGNAPVAALINGVRISQQTCTPNGQPYGAALAGLSPCSGGYNYTCTNFISVKRCWTFAATTCNLDLTASPLTIQPGSGITLYVSRYKDGPAFGWNGYVTVSFRWKQ